MKKMLEMGVLELKIYPKKIRLAFHYFFLNRTNIGLLAVKVSNLRNVSFSFDNFSKMAEIVILHFSRSNISKGPE